MREEVIVEKKEVRYFVASDGTKFDTETGCYSYECKLRRQELKDAVEEIETAKTSVPPFGLNSVDVDIYDYLWFRPKSKGEIDVLNEYYGMEFSHAEVGKWVGVEASIYFDEGVEDSWCFSFDGTVDSAKELFQALGYDMTLTEIGTNEELEYIKKFARSCEDYEFTLKNQLKSLWTAYCLRNNLIVDTGTYDTDLLEIYGEVESNSLNPFHSFDEFDEYMCEYLV